MSISSVRHVCKTCIYTNVYSVQEKQLSLGLGPVGSLRDVEDSQSVWCLPENSHSSRRCYQHHSKPEKPIHGKLLEVQKCAMPVPVIDGGV